MSYLPSVRPVVPEQTYFQELFPGQGQYFEPGKFFAMVLDLKQVEQKMVSKQLQQQEPDR